MIFVLPFLASIITVGAFKAGGGAPLAATFDMALLQTPGLVFLVPLRFIVMLQSAPQAQAHAIVTSEGSISLLSADVVHAHELN